LVLNDLRVHGTHTPSWNSFSIGVETVGEFEREAFGDPTRDNLTAALAALHEKLGLRPDGFQLGVRGLHFHKEDVHTTHRTCPGRNMVKADLVNRVVDIMGGAAPASVPEDGSHVHVPIAAQEAETSGMSPQELTSTKWLQTMLNRWNNEFHLTVDGVLGKKNSHTRTAVRAFQTALHLTVDGIPGPVTRKALKNAAGATK
jgi:peptidoglycan hydrolase-like protein with peptidoglycan-binding domain